MADPLIIMDAGDNQRTSYNNSNTPFGKITIDWTKVTDQTTNSSNGCYSAQEMKNFVLNLTNIEYTRTQIHRMNKRDLYQILIQYAPKDTKVGTCFERKIIKRKEVTVSKTIPIVTELASKKHHLLLEDDIRESAVAINMISQKSIKHILKEIGLNYETFTPHQDQDGILRGVLEYNIDLITDDINEKYKSKDLLFDLLQLHSVEEIYYELLFLDLPIYDSKDKNIEILLNDNRPDGYLKLIPYQRTIPVFPSKDEKSHLIKLIDKPKTSTDLELFFGTGGDLYKIDTKSYSDINNENVLRFSIGKPILITRGEYDIMRNDYIRRSSNYTMLYIKHPITHLLTNYVQFLSNCLTFCNDCIWHNYIFVDIYNNYNIKYDLFDLNFQNQLFGSGFQFNIVDIFRSYFNYMNDPTKILDQFQIYSILYTSYYKSPGNYFDVNGNLDIDDMRLMFIDYVYTDIYSLYYKFLTHIDLDSNSRSYNVKPRLKDLSLVDVYKISKFVYGYSISSGINTMYSYIPDVKNHLYNKDLEQLVLSLNFKTINRSDVENIAKTNGIYIQRSFYEKYDLKTLLNIYSYFVFTRRRISSLMLIMDQVVYTFNGIDIEIDFHTTDDYQLKQISGLTDEDIGDKYIREYIFSHCSNIMKWHYKLANNCGNKDKINLITGDIRELDDPNDPIISYGDCKGYSCYNMSDLMGSFRLQQINGDQYFIFENPDWTPGSNLKREFTVMEMTQLYKLLSIDKNMKPLADKIYEGLSYIEQSGQQLKMLRDDYRNFSDEEQQMVRDYLSWLFITGMTMRHWSGPGTPYTTSYQEPERCGEETRDINMISQFISGRDLVLGPRETDFSLGKGEERDDLPSPWVDHEKDPGFTNDVKEWISNLPIIRYNFVTKEMTVGKQSISNLLHIAEEGQFCMQQGGDITIGTAYTLMKKILNYNDNQINNMLREYLGEPKQPDFVPSKYRRTPHVDPLIGQTLFDN